jgi:hypothetical protein
MKIAEGLLLRKQLEAKVKQLEPLKLNGENGVYDTKVVRRKVSEDVDEVTLQSPRVDIKTLTKEYDVYASRLRRLDSAIQKANWQFDLDFSEEVEVVTSEVATS